MIVKNFWQSFKYAGAGILSALKRERNLKIHLLIMFLVIILGIIFQINVWEWIICFLCFGLVIGSELINTSLEITVDMITKKKCEQAKWAKDIAAGSVLVIAFFVFLVGICIFVPKLWRIIQ